MIPRIITKQFFLCPRCKEREFPIDHIVSLPNFSSLWYCDNITCGVRLSVRVSFGVLDVEVTDEFSIPSLVLLKRGDIQLIVKGIYDEDEARKIFYYNENTCPTNYLQECKQIYLDGQEDPHGIFKYVQQIRHPARELECHDDLMELFNK